ncbi:acyl-CoA dehydrogenase [candidate division KSB1 bacterium]|nr:MAG: acyl-CoA dehydrogenase [candidate division KSB1 bacterium]
MDYFLTEDQMALRDLVRQIAVEKVKPVAAQHDRDGTFPWDLVKIFAEAGLFSACVPENYGGMGLGIMELTIITEELSKACGGIALSVAASSLGMFPMLIGGTEELKQHYLPTLAAGKKLAAFCLTEPGAGSDAGAMKTRAEKKGDEYILNGTKVFITNGSVADVFTVIAVTDPSRGARGTAAFVVEKSFPGFKVGKEEDKMGIRASSTAEIIFEDCRVPAKNLLGREGEGFMIAMKTLDKSRPGVAAQALGIAQGAFDLALDYAKTRVQFGHPIISLQAVQFMLADMATAIESARALLYLAARNVDAGEKNIGKVSAMCKLLASDVAMKVTTDAVQIFGGYGYMRDYPIEKYMRDAKITQIYEGTNQIQRMVIARSLTRD